MFPSLKRKLMMPYFNIKRKRLLYKNCMTPEEIQAEEKKLHEMMLIANQKNQKAQEQEYMFKRDILRKVLKIG